jgi:uncharacterized protein (TIGR03435 family)
MSILCHGSRAVRISRLFVGVFIALISVCPLTGTAQATPSAAPATAPTATAPSPQDIVGTWQGTLHIAAANRDLRIVDKIGKNDKGELKVMFYSIDQPGQGISATGDSFQDGVLKYSIDFIQGKYEGKMSADGKTITGTWTQGPNPIALNLERANADTAWAIPEPPKTMPADANPSFDVATIKPSTPGRPGKAFGFRGRSFITVNTDMNDLVAFAYGLHAKQIVGAPDWFSTDLFDIDGVPDVAGQPNLKQMGVMVQKLLTDRFKLTFHREQRDLSVYILTVASGGPKMKTTTAAANDPQGFGFRALGDLSVRNMNMKEFASWMQTGVMDKPVVDQTGLTEKYDFHLKWTPDDSQFAQFRGTGAAPSPPSDDPNAPPSLYTAIQEQIGLKIGPGKAPDDVIVIDHVEKPSAN